MTVLAELEVHHSRSCAPTRRIALGEVVVAGERGGEALLVLLGAVVAGFVPTLTVEQAKAVDCLVDDMAAGRRVVQPRAFYRLQRDRHGLDVSRHRLLDGSSGLAIEVDRHGPPLPQALGAVYAIERLRDGDRDRAVAVVARAVSWRRPVGSAFLAELAALAGGALAQPDADRWALAVLELAPEGATSHEAVRRQFRRMVRSAHPDRGADPAAATQRIDELARARQILLRRIERGVRDEVFG